MEHTAMYVDWGVMHRKAHLYFFKSAENSSTRNGRPAAAVLQMMNNLEREVGWNKRWLGAP